MNSNQITTDRDFGLTKKEVKKRKAEGYSNKEYGVSTKSLKEIIFKNVFTFFNCVNFVLAFLLILVGSYRNLLFLGVVIANIIIGILQEVKAKNTIDKLSLIAKKGTNVIREGILKNIPDKDLVKDDIMVLESGDQIPVDGTILEGVLEINESMLTGENTPVFKGPGDDIFSGSFIVSGNSKNIVTNVGNESYAGQITAKVKKYKKNHSEIQDSINVLIKIITFSIVPLGILMFLKEYFISGNDLTHSVVLTAGSLIALIPSGLVLLTSTVFVISVIKLSRYKALIQEMSTTETLARVDVLCLDKTGTITEGKIELEDVIPLDKTIPKNKINEILNVLSKNLKDKNPTINAIRKEFSSWETKSLKDYQIEKVIPFSSQRKYSGITFKNENKTITYILGAGSFILRNNYEKYKEKVDFYAREGKRVVFLAEINKAIKNNIIPYDLKPLAILIFTDIIRKEAPETLKYFEDQGVELKIISGDDPLTASQIAKRAGFKNYEKYIDARNLKTIDDIEKNISKFSVFGRVTPEQKQEFVKALKRQGHTVAMTGDGVNDVLALKSADTSIAMASGSDAARNIANIVLVDSDFSTLPKVVAEGRQIINNLEKSASLYLSKTIFSLYASIFFLILAASYPFQPIQLTLINTITIGIPSVVLALEPNHDILRGKFFTNILIRALPAGLVTILGISLVELLGVIFHFDSLVISTLSVYTMIFTGLLLIINLSIPFNKIRIILLTILIALFTVVIVFFKSFFYLVSLNIINLIALLIVLGTVTFVYLFISRKIPAQFLTKFSLKLLDKFNIKKSDDED